MSRRGQESGAGIVSLLLAVVMLTVIALLVLKNSHRAAVVKVQAQGIEVAKEIKEAQTPKQLEDAVKMQLEESQLRGEERVRAAEDTGSGN